MKIWLDDERDPKNQIIKDLFNSCGDETWVKTALEAINLIKNNAITHISFDHDLGDPGFGTGLDVAKFIEEQAFYGKIEPFTWRVHSQNPVGAKNIIRCMEQAEKFWNTKDTLF